MHDESIPFDPLSFYRVLGPAMRVYCWFALVAVIVAVTRLTKAWVAALPVVLKRRAGNLALVLQLQTTRLRFQQWIGGTLLGGGLTFAIELYTISTRLPAPPNANLDEVRVGVGPMTAVVLGLTFSLALLLFLIQWHLLNRIEDLRTLNDSSNP